MVKADVQRPLFPSHLMSKATVKVVVFHCRFAPDSVCAGARGPLNDNKPAVRESPTWCVWVSLGPLEVALPLECLAVSLLWVPRAQWC